jgi:hypothetical protein
MFDDSTSSALHFFSEIVPRLMARPSGPRPEGRLCFAVEGRGGGSWTLDLSKRSVTSGPNTDAATRLNMTAEAFAALLAGKLDANAAFNDGSVRVDGAVELLVEFCRLLNLQ